MAEELAVRKRPGNAPRSHLMDLRAADQLDHHAHRLRRLHDGEFGQHWRRESREDVAGGGS